MPPARSTPPASRGRRHPDGTALGAVRRAGLPSSGRPSRSTTRPSSASPTGTRERQAVGLDRVPAPEDPQVVLASSEEPSASLQGGKDGTRAWAIVELPEDGLYTLSVFGLKGEGLRFLADHCLKAILCPSPQETHAAWWVVTTTAMTSGRHAIAVNLGPGSTVERIRLERKKAGDEDYVATLRRLGFDAGPPGNVTRARAVDAMEWVRGRRRQSARVGCGDVVPRSEVNAQVASQSAGPATPPGGGGAGSGGGGAGGGGAGGGGGTPPGPNPPIPLPSPGPSQPPGSAVTIASGDGR